MIFFKLRTFHLVMDNFLDFPHARFSVADLTFSWLWGGLPMSNTIKSGAMGAFMGLVMSALITFYLVPMPLTPVQNAIGNGISGLISGFMGGFMGVYMDSRRRPSADRRVAGS